MLGAGESRTPFHTIILRDDHHRLNAAGLASARYPISVPIKFAIYLDRRERWRQCYACKYMIDPYLGVSCVKIYKVAGFYIDGPNAEARLTSVDSIKIYKPFKRSAQRLGVIKAGRFGRAAQAQP